jgi:hypothetical protein
LLRKGWYWKLFLVGKEISSLLRLVQEALQSIIILALYSIAWLDAKKEREGVKGHVLRIRNTFSVSTAVAQEGLRERHNVLTCTS